MDEIFTEVVLASFGLMLAGALPAFLASSFEDRRQRSFAPC